MERARRDMALRWLGTTRDIREIEDAGVRLQDVGERLLRVSPSRCRSFSRPPRTARARRRGLPATPIRVRMALHSGVWRNVPMTTRADVNRVARLLSSFMAADMFRIDSRLLTDGLPDGMVLFSIWACTG